jgi:excisionase family DNA binding protein
MNINTRFLDPSDPKTDGLWDSNQMANYLGKSPQWLRTARSVLGIPAYKVGQQWRFRKTEVDAWLARHSIKADHDA